MEKTSQEMTFSWNSTVKVEFLKKLPSENRMADSLGYRPEKYLIIYDKKLKKNETVAKWLKDYPYTYAVHGGESLKDLYKLSGHIRSLFKLVSPFSARSLCIVALGGGTIGDFAGFIASVLKRGVPLIHIPSTLLAAMDSAHGGKTALNVAEVKNQIGTFYPAQSILIVRSLFDGLPNLQIQSAAGELVKMALLEGGPLYKRVVEEFSPTLESVWEFLPEVIEAKYKVVQKDPFEKSGERQVLNLGHSLGHALESYYGLPHGVAVGEGLIFAVEWSSHQGYFRGAEPEQVLDFLEHKIGFLKPRDFAKKYRSMSRNKLSKYISEDKKLTDTRHFNFIFLENLGVPFRKTVTLESFLTETQRQGWTLV